MTLSQAQLQTLATDLQNNTNQTVIDALAAGNNNALAEWYNQQASPDFFVFLNSVTVDEVRKSLDWSEVLDDTNGLTDLQQFGFNTLFSNGDYDPSNPNNRTALINIFPPGMTNTRQAVLADATKLASNAEKLFSTTATGPGGGDGSAANQSAVSSFLGTLSSNDINLARELI